METSVVPIFPFGEERGEVSTFILATLCPSYYCNELNVLINVVVVAVVVVNR